MSYLRRFILWFIFLAISIGLAGLGPKEVVAGYPEKPITIIVPFGAGGGFFRIARGYRRWIMTREMVFSSTMAAMNWRRRGLCILALAYSRSGPGGGDFIPHSRQRSRAASCRRSNFPAICVPTIRPGFSCNGLSPLTQQVPVSTVGF